MLASVIWLQMMMLSKCSRHIKNKKNIARMLKYSVPRAKLITLAPSCTIIGEYSTRQ